MPEIGIIRLDDTPVNGQLEKGITSNWAFDEDVALRALVESILPWIIDIDPFFTAKSNIQWDTLTGDGSQIHSTYKTGNSDQNAEITFDVILAAGTWSLEIIHIKNTDGGICSIQFDSVEKGTIDFYGTLTYRARGSVTGIVVPATKKIELKLKMTSKHASSSNYTPYLSGIRFLRTA